MKLVKRYNFDYDRFPMTVAITLNVYNYRNLNYTMYSGTTIKI